ncbi:glycosyltransferase family 2 protein [Xanthomonas sp. 3075]|uniref:glycosyltransferase family 2 protein n=1 Tax=Xanthomonas sp. 3075 TaxID=3035315 RepID=UPI00179CDB17|nr:glycosyltransferase family 2 protein [Xanthomonas sp. 3075]MBB4132421.1 GT2 family glycosyltransferase [Xanthomonas sp. 3075]
MVEAAVTVPAASQRLPTRMRLDVTPLANLACIVSGGIPIWESVGSDPQFALTHSALPLAAGWYRLRGSLRELDGHLSDPCLYPDYGSGIAEDTRIDLALAVGRGMLDAVVHFSDPLQALRFDPTGAYARFELGPLEIYRLSEREAFWLLLRNGIGERLRDTPQEALELADGARAQWREQGASASLQALLHTEREDARARDAGYATWAQREDRWLAGLVSSAHNDTSVQARVLSLIFHDQEEADFSACLEALACLAGQAVEIVADARQIGEWPKDRAMPSLRMVDASASLGARLRMAQANFVAVLAADDRIHPMTVKVLTMAACSFPAASVLYSDEDRVQEQGGRFAPLFKPVWDRLRWYEQDYLGRSAFVRRQEIEDGLLEGLDPEVPWFSLLSALIHERGVIPLHLPHVLRHVSGDVGPIYAPFARHEVNAAARARVLGRALRTQGAEVEVFGRQRLRVRYGLGAEPEVEIIIPTRDRIDLLERCIGTLLATTAYSRYRITVVDNGSIEAQSHAYFNAISQDARVRILRYDRPFNYSAINNYAVAQCAAQIVVLLNNDIEITDAGWLQELVRLALRPGAGAIGAKLFYPDGSLQHAGVVLGIGGVAAHAFAHAPHDFAGEYGRALVVQHYSAVTAACLAVTRAAYVAVGGLDESIAVAFNDVDFCLRLRAHGYENAWTPHAQAYHHESASRGIEDDPQKQARFAGEVATMLGRWQQVLAADPAYSPCLSLDGPAFSLDPDRHAETLARDLQPVYPLEYLPPVTRGTFPEG